jgi:hypothetical protein
MRRFLLISLAALVAVAALPGMAAAKQQPVYRTSGNPAGTVAGFDQVRATFEATANQLDRGDASGFYEFHRVEGGPLDDFRGNVRCLDVVGNTATMSGEITEAHGGFVPFVGGGFVATVVDNGPNGQGDLFSGYGEFGVGTFDCVFPTAPIVPVTSGDVVVESCDKFKEKPGTGKDKCKSKP